MKNKELQDKRIREYFKQATKSILKGEGLKSISVRNIAREAGYSYTTLYNYFKDVSELVFLCVNDFQEEIQDYVIEQSIHSNPGKERIKAKIEAYVKYFVNYPGIFELFYLERIGDLGSRNNTINVIGTSLDSVYQEDFKHFVENNQISITDSDQLKNQIRNSVIGSLLFYLNRRMPESYKEFTGLLSDQLDRLLHQL